LCNKFGPTINIKVILMQLYSRMRLGATEIFSRKRIVLLSREASQRGRNEQVFKPIVTIDKAIEFMSRRFEILSDASPRRIGQEIMADSPSPDSELSGSQMAVKIVSIRQKASQR